MLTDGYTIEAADLNGSWAAVADVAAVMSDTYELAVHSFIFDGVHGATTTGNHYWVPACDAQIIGITATTAERHAGHTGTVSVQLTGNISAPITATVSVDGAANTRTAITAPAAGMGVSAGDLITATITATSHIGDGPSIFRVHILYRPRWSRR